MRFLAASLLALAALAPAAAQPPRHDHGPRVDRHGGGPRHDMRRHHRHCRTVWHHGHRVRRCD